MKAICTIKTPFPEKFGVPRQSLLVKEALGVMTFPKNDFFLEAFRGIEECSHLWLIFEFHGIPDGEFNGLVRPPRFHNKKKLGVYATRSPHRPNRLGLSVVEFLRVEMKTKEIELWVSGVDLVDGTPILDIKPYVPYADIVTEARAINFETPPSPLEVEWKCDPPSEKNLIEKIVALDPRPSQDSDSEEIYGVSIAGRNVQFQMKNGIFQILSV